MLPFIRTSKALSLARMSEKLAMASFRRGLVGDIKVGFALETATGVLDGGAASVPESLPQALRYSLYKLSAYSALQKASSPNLRCSFTMEELILQLFVWFPGQNCGPTDHLFEEMPHGLSCTGCGWQDRGRRT